MHRPRRRAIVLMYHRIACDDLDPWGLSVSPANFAGQLDVLTQRATVLPLACLIDALDRDALPAGGVAITFDDGYADNLHAAKPLLERHGAPATVFVVAGMIGSARGFWWDELQQIVFAPETLPGTLELQVGGSTIHINPGTDSALDTGHGLHRDWRFHEPPPTPRHALYQTLWKKLQPCSEPERRQALDNLRARFGIAGYAPPTHRIMDEAEVLSLADGGLVEIGAHTMTHPVLSTIPASRQAWEIAGSKVALEQILDAPVTSFSYPHGGRRDYNTDSITATREAGFHFALTTTEDWLRPAIDRYQLPRIYAPNLPAAEFERLLWEWL